MLDGTADADGDVELWGDDLAGLADLSCQGLPQRPLPSVSRQTMAGRCARAVQQLHVCALEASDKVAQIALVL